MKNLPPTWPPTDETKTNLIWNSTFEHNDPDHKYNATIHNTVIQTPHLNGAVIVKNTGLGHEVTFRLSQRQDKEGKSYRNRTFVAPRCDVLKTATLSEDIVTVYGFNLDEKGTESMTYELVCSTSGTMRYSECVTDDQPIDKEPPPINPFVGHVESDRAAMFRSPSVKEEPKQEWTDAMRCNLLMGVLNGVHRGDTVDHISDMLFDFSPMIIEMVQKAYHEVISKGEYPTEDTLIQRLVPLVVVQIFAKLKRGVSGVETFDSVLTLANGDEIEMDWLRWFCEKYNELIGTQESEEPQVPSNVEITPKSEEMFQEIEKDSAGTHVTTASDPDKYEITLKVIRMLMDRSSMVDISNTTNTPLSVIEYVRRALNRMSGNYQLNVCPLVLKLAKILKAELTEDTFVLLVSDKPDHEVSQLTNRREVEVSWLRWFVVFGEHLQEPQAPVETKLSERTGFQTITSTKPMTLKEYGIIDAVEQPKEETKTNQPGTIQDNFDRIRSINRLTNDGKHYLEIARDLQMRRSTVRTVQETYQEILELTQAARLDPKTNAAMVDRPIDPLFVNATIVRIYETKLITQLKLFIDNGMLPPGEPAAAFYVWLSETYKELVEKHGNVYRVPDTRYLDDANKRDAVLYICKECRSMHNDETISKHLSLSKSVVQLIRHACKSEGFGYSDRPAEPDQFEKIVIAMAERYLSPGLKSLVADGNTVSEIATLIPEIAEEDDGNEYIEWNVWLYNEYKKLKNTEGKQGTSNEDAS